VLCGLQAPLPPSQGVFFKEDLPMKIFMLLVASVFSLASVAETIDTHIARLEMDARRASTQIITPTTTQSDRNRVAQSAFGSGNYRMGIVFSIPPAAKELRQWLKTNQYTLLNASITDEPHGRIKAGIFDVYTFGKTRIEQFAFIRENFKEDLAEANIPVEAYANGDIEPYLTPVDDTSLVLYFPRIDIVVNKDQIAQFMHDYNSTYVAAVAILGPSAELSPVMSDTSILLRRGKKGKGRKTMQTFNSSQRPGPTESDIEGFKDMICGSPAEEMKKACREGRAEDARRAKEAPSPSASAKFCGSGSSEKRCPYDDWWVSDDTSVAASMTQVGDVISGYAKTWTTWNPAGWSGYPTQTASWTFPWGKECIPVSDTNFTKKCLYNQDDVYIKNGTYEAEVHIPDRGCRLTTRTGTSYDKYYGCLTPYWFVSNLPDNYKDDTALDPGHTLVATVGAVGMRTILGGVEYKTHLKFWAKRGKLSYLTDSVKHYGQIGVNSFIGPYAIDTSSPLNTTRIWIVN